MCSRVRLPKHSSSPQKIINKNLSDLIFSQKKNSPMKLTFFSRSFIWFLIGKAQIFILVSLCLAPTADILLDTRAIIRDLYPRLSNRATTHHHSIRSAVIYEISWIIKTIPSCMVARSQTREILHLWIIRSQTRTGMKIQNSLTQSVSIFTLEWRFDRMVLFNLLST